MALLKIWRTVQQHGPRAALKRVMHVGPNYLFAIRHWRVRRCECCLRPTIFIAHNNRAAEFRSCLFCSANERYEMLASEIRSRFGSRLKHLQVLELDPHSPLRSILSAGLKYTRSFYEEGSNGAWREGAVCQDITALTFKDYSFDLIVSSEVLEHVPHLERAFQETARVLKPGGAHLVTVPPRAKTKKRAEIVDGYIKHLETPDYHFDPLSPQGILAFWDVGPDLPDVISCAGLNVRIVRGPAGEGGRVVWIAEKPGNTQGN